MHIKKLFKIAKTLVLSTSPIRKIRYRKGRNGIVSLDEINNFENICNKNISFIASDAGLWYLGRFNGISHSFVCVDRQKLCEKILGLSNVIVEINRRSNLSKVAIRRLFKKNQAATIVLYQLHVTPNYVPIFGRREGITIYVPKEIDGQLIIPRKNPVAFELFISEPVATVEISGFKFVSPVRFINYYLTDKLRGQKVDVVYTWVNGSDSEWLRRKEKYIQHIDSDKINPTSIADSRFRQIEELKYSIRSLYLYTNFVNRVYIVTDQQTPDWLVQNEFVQIVDHKDIFPDPSVLPTFNSHAIEACLHRIPGLLPHFLYLNDDMAFSRSVTLDKLFTPKMFPRIHYSNYTFVGPGKSSPDDMPVDTAARNARDFLFSKYDYWVTRKFKHVPCAINKLELEKLVDELSSELDETRSKRFRTPRDFSLLTCTWYHYMAMRGDSGRGRLTYGYHNINNIRQILGLYVRLTRGPEGRPDVFCINDVDGEISEWANRLAIKSLKTGLSLPSPVENIYEHAGSVR